MTVNSNYFGDPCIGSADKQLFVQFLCVDAASNSSFTAADLAKCAVNETTTTRVCPRLEENAAEQMKFEQNWCQPSVANITCPINMVINVICAFYGIDKSIYIM
jgi:hypothetical protein